MPQPNDLSRSLVALDQDSTITAVVEMSQSMRCFRGQCVTEKRWRATPV
jgi:hypothetical protein